MCPVLGVQYKTARIAGLLCLIEAFSAPFGEMFVRDRLFVPGDATTTASNIISSQRLYRLGLVSDLITQAVHTLLVLFLFKLLKQVNRTHALLMAIWGLVAVPIAMLNELNHMVPLLLLRGSDYLTVFKAEQVQALVPLFIGLHEYGVSKVYLF